MATNPYTTLGVVRTASQEDIRRAYRKLAKRTHPDLAGSSNKHRFEEIAQAYALLSDKEKRRRFDQGEIDSKGDPRAPSGFSHPASGGKTTQFGARSSARTRRGLFRDRDPFSAEDIIFDILGEQGPFPENHAPPPQKLRLKLSIPFITAAKGGKSAVVLPDSRCLELKVPPGSEPGQVLKLSDKKSPGGSVLVALRVEAHSHFSRRGRDIWIDLPITLSEAVTGTRLLSPTIHGPVALIIPPGAASGKPLRLKEHGIRIAGKPAGDQYVRCAIVLPPKSAPILEKLLAGWNQDQGFDPRYRLSSAINEDGKETDAS